MNCSLALLEAVAKYAFEIGLKPLIKMEMNRVNHCCFLSVNPNYLLLFAELVFVVKKLQTVENVLHGDQRIGKVL